MKFKVNSDIIISYILAASLFLLVFLLIWISNKGFDLTDESYYFIGYYNKIDPNLSVSFFHRIYYQFIGSNSIIISRIIRVILTLLSSFFLGYVVGAYFKFERKIESGLFVALFSILSYAFYPPTLSYNSMTIILFNSVVILQFIYFKKKSVIIPVILGFVLTLLILTKFTSIFSIVLFFGVLFVLNNYFKSNRLKAVFFNSQLLLLGVLLALISLFKTFEIFFDSIDSFENGLKIVDGHTIKNSFSILYYGFIHILSHSKYYILSILLLCLIHRFYNINSKIFIIITFIIYSLLLFKLKIITHPIGFFIPYFIFLVFTVFNSYVLKINLFKRNIFISFLFFILSFALSVGTNNSLYVHFIFNGSLLGLSIYILLYEFPTIYKVLSTLFLSIVIFIQVSNHLVFHPYRLNTPIYKQTEKLNCSALKNVKVDKKLMELNNDLIVFKPHPSHYVFLLADYLGCSLLINKIPYPFNWLEEKNFKNLDVLLLKSKPIHKDDLLLIIPSRFRLNQKNSLIKKSFKKINIDLEKDFKILKSVNYNGETFLIYGTKNVEFQH